MSITAETAIEQGFDSVCVLNPDDSFFYSGSANVPILFLTPSNLIIKKFSKKENIFVPTDYLIGCSMISKEKATVNFKERLLKTLGNINNYVPSERVLHKKMYAAIDFFSLSDEDRKTKEEFPKSYFYGERFGVVYELESVENLEGKYDCLFQVDNLIVGE
jgi:hypothetical protein